jgi:hypothetical protein
MPSDLVMSKLFDGIVEQIHATLPKKDVEEVGDAVFEMLQRLIKEN